MHYVQFLLICAIWGSNFMLMKRATEVFGPISIGAWRAIGGALALVVIWRMRKVLIRATWRDTVPLVGVALVGFAWPYAIQPYLVRRHGGGFVGMTVSLVPLLTILVSWPMLKVLPSRRQLIGVLVGLVCMGILMADGWRKAIPLLDLLLAVSVPLAYAVTNTYQRRRFREVDPLFLASTMLLITGALLTPIGLSTEPIRGKASLAIVAALVWLGTIGTGLTNFWFTRLVQERGPLFAGMVTYLVPLGAVFWGWFDQEAVTPLQLVALAGIMLMVALVQYPHRPAVAAARAADGQLN